jgi:rhamnose transport system substrate-binding protein
MSGYSKSNSIFFSDGGATIFTVLVREPIKSAAATEELLMNPEIRIIIAPTVVGMLAAGTYLYENMSDVLLTGLGLPSEMAPFIEEGICRWMYLWNPVDLGYLTAYTGYALVNNQITGDAGDTFFAGSMGERIITVAMDGGTDVMLGHPVKVDRANRSEWKEVY